MKIGYRNILVELPVTVSSEATGFEKENAYDGRTGGYWKPLSSPANLKADGIMPVGMWMGNTVAEILSASELVTDGDMSNLSSWSVSAGGGSTISLVGGALRITSTVNGASRVIQQINTEPGKQYTFSADLVGVSVSGGVLIGAGTENSELSYGFNYIPNPLLINYQFTFTPTSSVSYISFAFASNILNGDYVDWDNASVPDNGVDDLTINNNDLLVYGSILKSKISSNTGIVEYSSFATENYLEQPYNALLEFAQGDFFIGGWARINVPWPGTVQTLVHRGDNIGGGEFGLYVNQSATLRYASNSVTINSSGPKLDDGKHHFVAAIRRSQVIYLYVDGALVGSGADTSSQVTTNGTLRFGLNQSDLEPLTDGYLSLWSVDSVGTSSAEMKEIYDREKHYFINGGTLPETLISTRATTADYFAVYDHDFALTGSSIVLQYSDNDVSWSDMFDPIYPSTSSPIFKTFAQSSHKYWRVFIVGVRSIGVCMFGLRLDFKNGLTFGFSSPSLAQQFMPRTNISGNGEFIGRSISKKPISGNLVFNPVFSKSWIRQFWPELVKHIENKPFFVFPEDPYPDEALFCWVDRIQGPVYSSTFMSMSMPIKAKAS